MIFSFRNKNLSLEEVQKTIYKIQKTAEELLGESTDLKINKDENNFFFLRKYKYRIDFNLQSLQKIDDLELTFNIISPNRVSIQDKNISTLKVSKNFLKWKLIPGEINSLEFSFWSWNKLLFGLLLILLIIFLAYLIRFYRYQIGSNFPELPYY